MPPPGQRGSSPAIGPSSSSNTTEMAIEPMAIFRHFQATANIDHAHVTSYAFSDDGLHGISASRDRTLRLYDVGSVLLRDTYTLGQTGCQNAVFTHSSDIVAYTPAHLTEAPIYFLSLSTGRILSGINDAIADQRECLSEEFKEACAFSSDQPSLMTPVTASTPVSPTQGLNYTPVVPMPVAASASLALHPTTDIMVSVRKDGWGQVVVPTVGRPIALLKPSEADEGFAKRRRARISACTPLGSRPSVDKASSASSPALFGGYYQHAGGPSPIWFEQDADHATSSASFSPCGTYLSVSRTVTTSIYDIRHLSGGPVRVLASANLFAHRGRFESEVPTEDRDIPVIANAQLGSGGLMLVTSTSGSSTVVDAHREYHNECDFNDGVRVLYHYDGGGFAAQFHHTLAEDTTLTHCQLDRGGGGYALAAVAFPTPPSAGAIFATPSEGHQSMVVQPATRRASPSSAQYSVLVYGGHSSEGLHLKAAGTGATSAVLSHQLTPRDLGPARVLAANPRFGILATASSTVNWWAFE